MFLPLLDSFVAMFGRSSWTTASTCVPHLFFILWTEPPEHKFFTGFFFFFTSIQAKYLKVMVAFLLLDGKSTRNPTERKIFIESSK